MFKVNGRKALLLLKVFLLVLFVAINPAVAQVTSGGEEAKGSEICTQDDCPASVSDPIAAAFSTEGYWLMGNIVKQLTLTQFNVLAPLLYLVAAFAGLIMMSMGQPPRNYLWFMLGPAIYNWLLAPDCPVKGVAWEVGAERQPMRQVWQRAEVGLLNNNEVVAQGISVDKDNGPQGKVNVPYPFLWFDEVITGQVQQLSKFTGIYRQEEGTGNNNTNEKPSTSDEDERSWHLLTNSKWTMMENITAATIHSPNLRESFIVFLSSECGDKLAKHLNKSAYASAAYSKGLKLPQSVLTVDSSSKDGYDPLSDELKKQLIPVPRAVIEIARNQDWKEATSVIESPYFRTFEDTIFWMPDVEDSTPLIKDWKHMSCQMLLGIAIQGMRWEAGHAYNHFIREAADHGVKRENVLYDFLYGWEFDEPLTSEQQEQFIINLILLHIFRNEIAMAPSPTNPRWSPSERTVDYAEAYTRNVGSKSKYGELYTWAQLMPYVQGCTLYMIIIAYPFCVVLVVLPGWHKIMFTWMGFYTWAKSWDLGFAIVTSLERSIWAMIGHNEYQKIINDRVQKMQDYAEIKVDCPDAGADSSNEFGCPVANVTSDPLAVEWDNNMKILDEMFVMAPHLDLDLRNGYYVYLMSALYFAVPAVTGQIFLGAKAGAANMLSGFTQGASAAGEKAGAGFTSEITTRGRENEGTIGQEAYKKSLRSSGMASQALDAGNQALNRGLESQQRGQVNNAIGQQMQARGANVAGSEAELALGAALISGGPTALSGARSLLGFGAAGSAPGTSGSSPGGDTTSGSTPSGPTTGSGEGAVTPPGRWAGAANSAYAFGQMLSSAGRVNLTHGRNRADADDRGAMVDNSIAQFGAQGQQAGFQEGSNRLNQAAQHEAVEAKWRAMRNWSNQVSGKAASMGVFAGTFSPGQKSESVMGLASDGQLDTGREGRGESASSRFWYAADTSSSGGYMSSVSNAQSSLNNDYGSSRSGRYNYTPANAVQMLNQGGRELGGRATGVFSEGGLFDSLNLRSTHNADRISSGANAGDPSRSPISNAVVNPRPLGPSGGS